eukprot:TRINITY_DN34241_c0_g1_i1.p1 TRINITY_DN34241_c0_g1~~TRINITY_DN34241_c0_g1_i1.p1  ORF type:complete len:124 (+),score=15.18 TRINITY_DN34241_c0_g1_i1:130-501(+)
MKDFQSLLLSPKANGHARISLKDMITNLAHGIRSGAVKRFSDITPLTMKCTSGHTWSTSHISRQRTFVALLHLAHHNNIRNPAFEDEVNMMYWPVTPVVLSSLLFRCASVGRFGWLREKQSPI